MITIRKNADRGRTQLDWLDSYHSFSFGDYHDPSNKGFRSLRVINEDFIDPSGGFATHGHRDMEIITYMLSGTLAHKDSLNNVATITAGEIQRMTAGTGIQHSEFNHSDTESVHLLQIWIFPEEKNLKPGYEQKHFPPTDREGRLQLLVSRDGREDSLRIHQDAELYASILEAGHDASYTVSPNRHAWVQIARGEIHVNDLLLKQGDGASVSGETELTFKATQDAEFLLFDLA